VRRFGLVALLVATAASCTHRAVLPRGEGLAGPLEIHGRTDREVTIRLVDGTVFQASRVAATEDSLLWIGPGDGEARGAESLHRVVEVRAVNRARGARVGLLSGLGAGLGLTALFMIPEPTTDCGRGCGAAVGTMFFGGGGAVLGLIFGTAIGHTDTFTPTAPGIPPDPRP